MRARNIKPGFFKNEVLGTIDPLLALLFAGLWGLADREGRLEDRPLRIKAEIFPYREGLDVNGSLTELASLGFVERYVYDGNAYIQVLNFRKHQTPHKTEKASIIPAKPLINNTTGSDTVNLRDGNGTITAPLPPDSLIPDSLIPDSPPAQQQGDNTSGCLDRTRVVYDLPADWKAECTAETSWPENVTADIWLNFRGHYSKQVGKSAFRTNEEWAAAWRTWYRRERIPGKATKTTGPTSGKKETRDEYIARRERENESLQRFQQGARA